MVLRLIIFSTEAKNGATPHGSGGEVKRLGAILKTVQQIAWHVLTSEWLTSQQQFFEPPI
jgi:hypothetical protein